MTTFSFEIPITKLNIALDFGDSINIKLKKLNYPIIKISQSNHYYLQYNLHGCLSGYLETTRLTFNYPSIKINNDTFCASIDHENNIVKVDPNEIIPQQYYHKDSFCDHCNTKRKRSDTYIFKDPNNNFKQIGRTCLKKYFNTDPSNAIEIYEESYEIFNKLNTKIDYKINDVAMDVITAISTTLAIINLKGYVKKINDSNKTPCTSKLLQRALFPLNKSDDDWSNYIKASITDNDVSKAQLISDWALKEYKDSSEDFKKMVHKILSEGFIKYNFMGFIASLPLSYNYSNKFKSI